MFKISRRDLLKTSVAAGLLQYSGISLAQSGPTLFRQIPSRDETLPVVGLGTYGVFDVGPSEADRAPLQSVLLELIQGGGSVVDTAPMYGRAEGVVGDLIRSLDIIRDQAFIATKVQATGEAAGRRQIERSFSLLRTDVIDLYQVHNLQDLDTQLGILHELKQEGRVRYIGLTHYVSSRHDQLAALVQREKPDFIQTNFSIADRLAERELLPLCADHGVAVMINRPYQFGALFRQVRNIDLPAWAADFDCFSWGQFFLKYVLANQAVTCVIPGTSKPHHMLDNLEAGRGRLPNEDERRRMVALMESF